MDLPTTIALLGASLIVAVFCGWRGARPPDPAKGPRLMPYRALMLLAAALALFLLIHIASLTGLRPEG